MEEVIKVRMGNKDDHSLKKIIDVLYGILFFNIFTIEELSTILREARLIKWKKFGKGSKIFSEGSYDQHFYVIIHGYVSITPGINETGQAKGNSNGSGFDRLGKGDVFGEMVVCDPEQPRKSSACVSDEEDAILCEIDGTLIETVPPYIRMKFLKKFFDLILGRFRESKPRIKYYEDIVRYVEEKKIATQNDFFAYTLETAISEQNRLTQFIKYTDFIVAKKIDPEKGSQLLRELIVNAKDELDKSLNYST